MPTTHEFGPRGGYGDWEWHEDLATRVGLSYFESPEQSFRKSGGSPDNTTLRFADSVNVFETGALASGVTIENVDYSVLAVDAGMKYKGVFLQAEYYQRTLDEFDAMACCRSARSRTAASTFRPPSSRSSRSSRSTGSRRRSMATTMPGSATVRSTASA